MSARLPPRIFRRVPFEAELRLRFAGEDGEVTARTANISLGGMFVISDDARIAGTTFELQFKLPEQAAPVRGRGRVVWVRDKSEALDLPPGMGVRFLELTPGSRELIFEVVERRVRDGGSPYDSEGEDSATMADRRDDTGSHPAGPVEGAEDTLAGADGMLAEAEDAVAGAGSPAAPSPAVAEAVLEPAEPAPTAGDLAAPPAAAEPPAAAWEAGDERPAPAEEPPPAAWPPPVEMPEPPPRTGYPVAGSAYAGRSSRGSRGVWLAGGAVAVAAVVAVAGYLLLAGGERPGAGRGAPAAGSAASAAAEPLGGEDELGAAGDESGGDEVEAEATELGPPAEEEVSATAAEPAPTAPDPTGGERIAATPGAEAAVGAATDSLAEAGPAPDPVAGGTAGEPARPSGPPPAGAPARRVTRITWRQQDGATELEIWGDGRFASGTYRSSSLGGERPRELIRLTGIVEPFAGGSLEVGTREVSRVRTGHHVETDPDELHVVIDLAGPGVAASELRADGARLWLRLEGR